MASTVALEDKVRQGQHPNGESFFLSSLTTNWVSDYNHLDCQLPSNKSPEVPEDARTKLQWGT